MKRLLAAFLWAVLAVSLCAAPPVKIVGPTQIDPYKIVVLQAEGDLTGCGVIWDIDREDVADIYEQANGKLYFTGPPGTYKIKCRVVNFTTKDITTQRTVVTIGTPPPPVPPTPPPVPPTDPLFMSAQAAWTQETDPQKVTQAAQIASLYRQMALQLPNATNVNTVQDCFNVFANAEKSMGITPTTLPKTRRVLADYINSQIGTTGTALLDKVKAAAAFQKASDVAGGLK
jgi:hypothetical protein